MTNAGLKSLLDIALLPPPPFQNVETVIVRETRFRCCRYSLSIKKVHVTSLSISALYLLLSANAISQHKLLV